MGAIMDPQSGYAARDVVRAVGVSVLGRVDDVERRLSTLERAMVLGLRAFRGFRLGSGDVTVTPDDDGMVQLWSSDLSITINNDPATGAHTVNFKQAGL